MTRRTCLITCQYQGDNNKQVNNSAESVDNAVVCKCVSNMEESESLLASTRENGQLISPALTPSDEKYTRPLGAMTGGNDALDGVAGTRKDQNAQSSSELMGKQKLGNGQVTPKPTGRSRSATIPSPSTSISASPAPLTSSPRTPVASFHDENTTVPRLSPAHMLKLTSTPDSIPVRALTPVEEVPSLPVRQHDLEEVTTAASLVNRSKDARRTMVDSPTRATKTKDSTISDTLVNDNVDTKRTNSTSALARPSLTTRSITAPYPNSRRHSAADRNARSSRPAERPRIITNSAQPTDDELPKLKEAAQIPETAALPLPPFSIATHLHLELSGARPSPLYIHREDSSYTPYESSKVKLERLTNFLLLPPQLEQVLLFGALTCLDAWLYTFTILPLRFLRAFGILMVWSVYAVLNELRNITTYIWRRRKSKMPPSHLVTTALEDNTRNTTPERPKPRNRTSRTGRHHQRSTPSVLTNNNKADLLQGLLIIFSCILLMRFDASRIYHSIRGQSAMKLYVIYNVLEVFDRLFSALGQDILECLFSPEVLSRKSNGRSRVIRPFWMFLLALLYTVLHAMAFLYQVITLNVAVNSYSNALLTLLMSNQFVEIKGTVFKKFDKESLFQITCADIVERFQLWLMLLIIALRNIVELGGLSIPSGDFAGPASTASATTNSTTGVPIRTFSILPNSFTIVPYSLLIPAQVLVPFLVVLGSETLVDWVKHAYISKFNATSPKVYGLFLDVLAKDYYENAFAEQNLMKRLGLPVLPLACLFIRAALQTYHMFLATNVSAPLPSLATGMAIGDTKTSPVLVQIDTVLRNALGRSSFGAGSAAAQSETASGMFSFLPSLSYTLDDIIALTTMAVFFITLYLILLIIKLILGMLLLRCARDRFSCMKARERQKIASVETKRLGGWGTVELGEDRRKTIFESDELGLKTMRDRDARLREAEGKGNKGMDLKRVMRYNLGQAKRIW